MDKLKKIAALMNGLDPDQCTKTEKDIASILIELDLLRIKEVRYEDDPNRPVCWEEYETIRSNV